MISVIICSRNVDYLRQVTENIEGTIGIEYELLVWDNRITKYGICQVYNLLANKAKFPYLCFIHEDIFFKTANWGGILSEIFRLHQETGLIGVAGSSYKSRMYSGWYTSDSQLDVYNYVHRIDGVDREERQPSDGVPTFFPVLCIDGVFMACRREVWTSIRFDEQRLRGFHFYDIDFSLRTARKFGVAVTQEINLVHITQGGDYGDRWVETAMEYHSAQTSRLPDYLLGTVDALRIESIELKIARTWLDRLKNEPISAVNRWRWVNRQSLFRRVGVLWYPIVRFFVFRPLGLAKVQRMIKHIKSSR